MSEAKEPETILTDATKANTTESSEKEDNATETKENKTEEIENETNSDVEKINNEDEKEKDTNDAANNETNKEETKDSITSTSLEDEKYSKHVTYSEDGSAIYTDPESKHQYKWCDKDNNWLPLEQSSSSAASTDPYENEHYKWCCETQKWIPKQTQVTETEHYKWDPAKNEWIPKQNVSDVHTASQTSSETSSTNDGNSSEITYGIDDDGNRIYTDKDGMVYIWDTEKKAWFPKIDDDFMARYQLNYGFIDNTSASLKEKEERDEQLRLQNEQELEKLTREAKANDEAAKDGADNIAGVKRKQEPPKWFDIDPAHNTKVYVSNLPLDITIDEFAELMGKCGMIMRDPQTQKYKLKLYFEADGQMKGDGLCDYIKIESVDLALKILDEYELRGNKIRVQPAKFQMRGEYNPALKPKKKKKDKEKLAKIKEKLFDWRPEKMRGERSKNEKTVIIKNLFHPEIFEKEVQLILDYQNDLREECSKCGTVRKVVIYDRHSEGIAQINMASPEEADLVIQMMQGRFFGKRQLIAEHWDGKTKYKIEETEEEIQKRLTKWDQYLETEENKEAATKAVESKEDSPKEDSSKEASSKEESPKEDSSTEDSATEDSSKKASPEEASSEEASSKEAFSKDDSSKKEDSPKEVSSKEASSEDASHVS